MRTVRGKERERERGRHPDTQIWIDKHIDYRQIDYEYIEKQAGRLIVGQPERHTNSLIDSVLLLIPKKRRDNNCPIGKANRDEDIQDISTNIEEDSNIDSRE